MLTPKRDYDLAQRPDLWQKRVCETCGTVATTENDWKLHGMSRAHRRAVGVKKKRENAERAGEEEKDMKALQKNLVEVLKIGLGGMENWEDDEGALEKNSI